MGELVSQAGRKLVAVAVLLAAAWLLFKFVVVGLAAIAWVVVAVVAVAAVVWAIRVL